MGRDAEVTSSHQCGSHQYFLHTLCERDMMMFTMGKTMSFVKVVATLALLLIYFGAASGQAAGPTTGEITVQLVQGIDSSVNPNGKSEGRVTKSTNPAVPVGSTALLGLSSDPINGGYTVQLMRLGIRGTFVPAASSAVVLAPDIFNKMLEKTRAPGQAQDAVTGTRVFLPGKMIVRLTLAEPAQTAARQQSPESTPREIAEDSRPPVSTPAWRMLPPDTSNPNEAAHSAALAGVAQANGRRGPAGLTLGCTSGHYAGSAETYARLPVNLRVQTSMAAFMNRPGYHDFSCQGDGATGSPSVYVTVAGQSLSVRNACFDGDKPNSPVAPIEFGLSFEDALIRHIADSRGGELVVRFRESASSSDDLVARFPLPDQAPAVQQMIAPCLDLLAAEYKKERDSVVLECPIVEQKALSNVAVLTGPMLKPLAPDGENDIGTVWDIPRATKAHPVRPKVVLACTYSDEAGTTEKKVLPIPATAVRCASREDEFTNVPYGRCLNHSF